MAVRTHNTLSAGAIDGPRRRSWDFIGGCSFLSYILAFIGWVLGTAAAFNCSFFRVKYTPDDQNGVQTTLSPENTLDVGFWWTEAVDLFVTGNNGIYYLQEEGRCAKWSSKGKEEFDGAWYFAMVVTIVSLVVPVLFSFFVILFYTAPGRGAPRAVQYFQIGVFWFVGSLNLLLLVAASSDVCHDKVVLSFYGQQDRYYEAPAHGCDLGPSAYVAIVSFIFYYLAALALFVDTGDWLFTTERMGEEQQHHHEHYLAKDRHGEVVEVVEPTA